ncbi:hypothetical protein ACFFTM_21340 [Pseudoduganella plicata]|uniref:Uncharacterized protein n=1 Tax=Pseudoduganella plicata TaxID=321984 RepID=A0A4P7BIG8_9BURK|nr:hypothetical protein [Pseudoduganella plicata]QBQ38083.1 hypothetical protein E1742_19250 [Pseudoduganella plicata]GGZ03118.1 hypothetical protein GCM10007388_40950 [Pseudoduganella plicata]
MTPVSLLPHEPRVPDPARQQMLTERFLLPELASLRALFLQLRASVDAELTQRYPVHLGQPYPAGRCLEISTALQAALAALDFATLPPAPADGYRALVRFLQGGGNARVVWGAQHGQALRHVLLFGTLCIDGAQDSADAALPPVALTPFSRIGLTPVHDHRQYALLAGRAGQAHVFPNHVLPELAPYAPLLVMVPGGSVQLAADTPYMLALARRSGFTSSAGALTLPGMPDHLFRVAAQTLMAAGFEVAENASEGRTAGLERCRQYRDARPRTADAQQEAARVALDKANRALHILTVAVQPARRQG